MSNPALCRVCLASDIKMRQIANTRYQEIFEKLLTKLCTEDGRPQTVCYMCFSQLQRCSRLMDLARKTEEILTQFSCSGIMINKDTINILQRKFVNKLIQTPLQYISVNIENTNIVKKEHEDLTNVKLESVSDLADEEETIEKDKNFDECKSSLYACDIIVKQEIDSQNEVNKGHESSDFTEEAKRETEIDGFSEGVNETSDHSEAVKKEVIKEEVDESSLDEAEQEDPEQSYYQEISITNLQPPERHACTFCDKSYGQKCHLNRHLKSHRSKEYTCEVCGMRFTQKSTFKKHYYRHTNEKPFACNICPARCTQKIDLDRHMMLHTGQKPFTCDICQQTFSRKCNLKLHILTHADNKPFVCHVCNSTFSRRYDLNRHNKRKHTGEKPYGCNKCDFRSVNASYLKTHIENKHWKERVLKSFTCEECGFKCGTANYLKVHIQKKH